MVTLSRIYTKTGDAGQTALGDGSRVAKNHARVTAYGEVDELNAILGLLISNVADYAEVALVRSIQNELFDLGADLCVPMPESGQDSALRITAGQVERLEKAIDRLNETLKPLQSFVLPGGGRAAAWLHLARTVCRRAERAVVTLTHNEKINTHALIYLNRLSDFLFVLARVANNGGKTDVLWIPGANRGE